MAVTMSAATRCMSREGGEGGGGGHGGDGHDGGDDALLHGGHGAQDPVSACLLAPLRLVWWIEHASG